MDYIKLFYEVIATTNYLALATIDLLPSVTLVDDNYQGNGLGKMIVNELLDALNDMTILLYAAINKENFYEKLGF